MGNQVLEEPIKPKMYSPLYRQILVASGPTIFIVSSGMTLGYSAILLPQLEEEDSIIKIDVDQASWIASISTLPMILGCLLSTFAMELCGRKMLLLLTTVPSILGWLTIGIATSFETILVGRFLTGLCVGLVGPSSSVYIGETSDPKYRGFLLTTNGISTALGLLLTHLLGTFLSWKIAAYSSIFLPILSIVFMLFVPESPAWLLNKMRINQAEESFYWCRGYSSDSIQEFAAMMNQQTTRTNSGVSLLHAARPQFWKPLLIMNVFYITSQFSGVNAVAFYSVSIMEQTVGVGMNKYVAMMIVDSIRLVASIAACFLTQMFGRRPLVSVSTLGTATCLSILSFYLYMSKLYANVANLTVIPLLSLMGYVIFISVGLVPLPWTMIGEIFPKDMRGMGSGICTSMNFIATFIVVKFNPVMTTTMESFGLFLFYGCVAFTGFCFLYFTLPETKGRTLQQIELHFNNSNNRSNV